MINFGFLSPFQLTTFVLGIVFSILTISFVFYTLTHPNGYRNEILKTIFTFILPSVTMVMWFMCVFAAYEIFESELYIILLSFGCGIVIAGLMYLIAWLINRKYGKTTKEEEAELISEFEHEAHAEPYEGKKENIVVAISNENEKNVVVEISKTNKKPSTKKPETKTENKKENKSNSKTEEIKKSDDKKVKTETKAESKKPAAKKTETASKNKVKKIEIITEGDVEVKKVAPKKDSKNSK